MLDRNTVWNEVLELQITRYFSEDRKLEKLFFTPIDVIGDRKTSESIKIVKYLKDEGLIDKKTRKPYDLRVQYIKTIDKLYVHMYDHGKSEPSFAKIHDLDQILKFTQFVKQFTNK